MNIIENKINKNLLTLEEKFFGIEKYAYIIKTKKEDGKEILFLYNYNIIKGYFIFDGEFRHYFLKTQKNKIIYYIIQNKH